MQNEGSNSSGVQVFLFFIHGNENNDRAGQVQTFFFLSIKERAENIKAKVNDYC